MAVHTKLWKDLTQKSQAQAASMAASHQRALEYLSEWTTVLITDFEERFPRSAEYLLQAQMAKEVTTRFGSAIQINWRGRLAGDKSHYMRKGFEVASNHVLLCRAVEIERQGMRGVGAHKYRPNLARLQRGKQVWYVQAKIPSPVSRSLKRTVVQMQEQLQDEGAWMVIYHDRPGSIKGLPEEFGRLVEVKAMDELGLE